MPIIIPDDRLLSRKEVADLLQVSYDAIADRACGTDCLLEIRQTKKVQFNPLQVLAHRDAVWIYGKCEGRCVSALQPQKRIRETAELRIIKKQQAS